MMRSRVKNYFILAVSILGFLSALGFEANSIAAEPMIEGQVSVKYTKLALSPNPPIEPGSGTVGPGGGLGDPRCGGLVVPCVPGCGTVAPCEPGCGAVVPCDVTDDQDVSQTLPYKDREGYKKFLKARKKLLLREGKRLQVKYGLTIISSNEFLGTQLLKLPSGMSVEEAIKLLNLDPHLERVEPNFRTFLHSPQQTSPPNEPKWISGDLWGRVKIGMKNAWEISKGNGNVVGNEEIIVAVIDTGLHYTHPDLVDNLWRNLDETPGNGFDELADGNDIVDDIHGADWCHFENTNPSGDPLDDNGHGTEVSGVIAARGNNEAYVAGMTWVIQLMALKTQCGEDGTGNIEHAADAITYAVWNGALIINMSLGQRADNGKLREAVEFANCQGEFTEELGCRPALIVASVGNNNGNNDTCPMYPASYGHVHGSNNVISVAAVNQPDQLFCNGPPFGSNWGSSSVDIAAPGDMIHTTFPTYIDDLDPSGNGVGQATSIAAPFVSGCAALLQATRRNLSLPVLPASQLREIILESAEQVSELGTCGGAINGCPGENNQNDALCTGLNGTEDCVVQRRRLNCLRAFDRLPVCSGTCGDTVAPASPVNLNVTP